jgi:hypothetical protein
MPQPLPTVPTANSVAGIVMVDGKWITYEAWHGKFDDMHPHHYSWPNQGDLPAKDWVLWCKALSLSFVSYGKIIYEQSEENSISNLNSKPFCLKMSSRCMMPKLTPENGKIIGFVLQKFYPVGQKTRNITQNTSGIRFGIV